MQKRRIKRDVSGCFADAQLFCACPMFQYVLLFVPMFAHMTLTVTSNYKEMRLSQPSLFIDVESILSVVC
jgi:hypothetical protein